MLCEPLNTILGIFVTIKIAYIRCWKMSGANVVNYMFCTHFDVNFANSFLDKDGPGECRLCKSHFLVEKVKCKQLCMKANVLKSLKIIWMLWRSYFLCCMIQHQQPWFSAASMNAQEMTARVCMVEPEEQLSTRAAAAATWRSVEHQSYNMASTFLQDGDHQRGRWSVTKHGACHLEPKIPSGAGQKRNTRLSCAGIWCCFGFFPALSCTFFLSEFKPDVTYLPFLSAYVGFHTCLSLQGQILKFAGNGSKWLIHFGKADLSSGSK